MHLERAGSYKLAVNYEDIGFAATPRMIANSKLIEGSAAAAPRDEALAAVRVRDLGTRGKDEKMLYTGATQLKTGDNKSEIAAGRMRWMSITSKLHLTKSE